MDQNQTSPKALADAIKKRLESLSSLSTECCIYRVPTRLRKLRPEAYSPRVISIGPFHHGKKKFQAMEEHKLRYLQSFISRTSLSLEDLVRFVGTWEERVRNFYAGTINLKSDKFVKMLIADGSFMVEFLLRSKSPQLRSENDWIFKPSMVSDVRRDTILLENQLPLSFLKGMFALAADRNQPRISSPIEIIHLYFYSFLNINGLAKRMLSSETDYFLDLLRSAYLPSVPQEMNRRTRDVELPRGAIELQDAGVKFKPWKDSNSSLDISYSSNGVLLIPYFVIGDLTETLYRNIIAFEQCHFRFKTFSHYVVFLSKMIKSPQDADLLVKHGIIANTLGNGEDVSRLFNEISKEVMFSGSYFHDLSIDLNTYCNSAWNQWKATLTRDYFRNPWSVASLTAASLLLILTFIQAICSILAL